jgi:cation:H+ antiporter
MWSDVLLDWISANMISRGDWLVLLWFFIIFLVYSFSITKTWDVKNQVEWEIQKISVSTSIFFMVLWITWLTLWWQWIVNWAINIAESFGIKESVIWLTIVAIGTSLPELATSIVAAYKKESDIAIWNVVWSNIFNVFLILWLTAIISPIPISDGVSIDISVAIVASLILLAIMYIGKKYTIEKWQGGIMVALYVSYLVFLVVSS